MPGTPLVMVADGSRELRISLGAQDLARGIAPGTVVEWRDAAGTATGTVREIGPIHQGRGGRARFASIRRARSSTGSEQE